MTDARYFATAALFRDWLSQHAATATELLVGFHKVGSGVPSMTWPQSVDEALCHGWIDGVRRNVDELRYSIRFTPRKPTSHWSAVNIAKVRVLIEQGRMTEAGLRAWALRTEERSVRASYEQAGMPELSAAEVRQFKRHRAAWAWFEAQPPGYRKQMIWRVINVKQAATRERRLALLIEASAAGTRL